MQISGKVSQLSVAHSKQFGETSIVSWKCSNEELLDITSNLHDSAVTFNKLQLPS